MKDKKEEWYDSIYCNVRYIENDNVVLLTWKQFAALENYRKPTTFALELLRNNKNSNFVVDARNGFEDTKEDVEWGFSYLLPNMAQTDCKKVVFILNEVNEIEEEMNLWTAEFSKYFSVIQVTSYEQGIGRI